MRIQPLRLLFDHLHSLAELGHVFRVFLMLVTIIGMNSESSGSECNTFLQRLQALLRDNGEERILAKRGKDKIPVSENLLHRLTDMVLAKETGEFESGSVFQMTTGNGTRRRVVTEVSVLPGGEIQFRDLADGMIVTSLVRITRLHRILQPKPAKNGQSVTGELVRRYPPPSSADTIMNGRFRNQHEIPFIRDAEIREVHQPLRMNSVRQDGESLRFGINEFGRAVIQQQALRGCTAAAANMLIHDNNRPVDLKDLRNSNLGNENTMAFAIIRAGLKPVLTTMASRSMRRLEDLISQNGPAIISVGGEIGGHVIVVDAIDYNAETARIRDPYHGWDITIDLNALRHRVSPNDTIVQVERTR